jgi:hypothetical protein
LLVGVHVDADGQSARAGGHNDVNEAVVQKIAGAAESCFLRYGVARRGAFLFFRVLGGFGDMLSYFFHNLECKLTPGSSAHYTVIAKKLTFFAGAKTGFVFRRIFSFARKAF